MQGPDTRAPCEQPPPQSIRSAHLFRFLCALCPRALESPSQPFRAAIDLSGALLWLTHPRPSSRRDSAVTSFLSPPWHGDQVPLEPGSGSARPPERIPVLGGACVPNPHPVYPQSGGARVPILSEPAQSSPAVLQPAVGPTQPHYPGPGAAGNTATEWVRPRRQPRAPSLCVRPPPRAHARPYTPRASPQGPPPPAAPPHSPGPATWGGQRAALSHPGQPGPLPLCIPGSHPTSRDLIHPFSRIPSLTHRGPAGSSILWKSSICPSVPFVRNSLASTLK